MIFCFAAIFESGQIVEQERLDSGTFDRNAVANYRKLIDAGEDFGDDLANAHLEYTSTGQNTALVEISSDKGDIVMHLFGTTDPAAALRDLKNVLTTIHNPDEPIGDILQNKTWPLALTLLPADAGPDVRALSRYPIALAAAFFEAKSI
jgi:hypothetical protein